MASPQHTVWTSLKEGLRFIWRFIQKPSAIGAILPSSDRLAKALVKPISANVSPKKRYILEVGPGTGVISQEILRQINPDDELHLVESDHDFCAQLREKFAHVPNIKIIEGSITDFNPEIDMHMPALQKYDVIISGLPFNSFDKSTVEKILSKYENLATEGGAVSYFEYLFLPTLLKLFIEKRKANQLDQLLKLKEAFYNKFGKNKERIWVNMPPAQVVHHTLS